MSAATMERPSRLKPGEGFKLPTTRILLHGRLAKEFGRGPREWGCETAREAIRALCVMVPGFRQKLAEGDYLLRRGPRKNGFYLDEEALGFRISGADFHVIPAAKGRGGNMRGAGKIVAGVALVALAIYSGGAAAPAAGGLIGGGSVVGISASSIGMVGVSLIFSGAASLLAPQPKTPRPREKEGIAQNPSFLFDGPGMTMEQGRIVPVVYGRNIRVGGVLIASSYQSADYNPAGNAAATPAPAEGIGPEGQRLIRMDPATRQWVYVDDGTPLAGAGG